jgi:hypothetical protein
VIFPVVSPADAGSTTGYGARKPSAWWKISPCVYPNRKCCKSLLKEALLKKSVIPNSLKELYFFAPEGTF